MGRIGIVSFPNFAHWPSRFRVVAGRIPATKAMPHEWYDTPNIRVGTFAGFEVVARKTGLVVTESFGLQGGQAVRTWPNLLASVAVFRFERRSRRGRADCRVADDVGGLYRRPARHRASA